jgi:hypothetical protein
MLDLKGPDGLRDDAVAWGIATDQEIQAARRVGREV